MPLYSDSSNYYYSGGSSQLYSPYYSSGLSAAPSSYTSSYNRSYPGSYMVPLLPSTRSPSYSSSTIGSSIGSSTGSNSSSLLGLSSRYQPKLTTITEASTLTGRHSGHSSLMPLTRIQSPKYSSVGSYGSSSTGSTSSSNSSSSRYIPPRPIAINTADIDVSSARYRRSAEPSIERKREPSVAKEDQQQQQEETQQQEKPQQQQQLEQQQQQQQPRRSTIRRNRAVVRLSTIRRRSKERVDSNQQQQQQQQQPLSQQQQQQQRQQQEHQFRDLPPAAEPSLSWRQKLAEELSAFPATSNKKSPGELLRERFYIHDEKQQLAEMRQQQQLQLQQRQQQQKPADQQQQQQTEEHEKKPEENEDDEILDETTEQVQESIRRLSLVQCPTFHDICEDISSDKIDDDLNAGELRRRASIIQEQEQELLNKLQKSNSGSFQLIHLERRSSHDSTTADESQSSTVAVKQPKRKSKKLRHKITAIVEVENAVTNAQQQHHMPSVLELIEETTSLPSAPVSPKPKFTVNVETVEEHQQIHKIFKLPKKKVAPKVDQVLPEGFMKAQPKAKTSPIKKSSKERQQQQQEEQEQQMLQEKQQQEENEQQQLLLQEKQLKEKQLKEQQLKEKMLQEQQLQEKQLKEQQLQEKLLKEQQLQEKLLKEQQLQEKQLKEQQLQEKLLKEQQLQEKQLKEQQLQEKLLKEQQLKEKQLKEQQLQEKQLKEQQLQEKQLREQQLKEQQLQEKKQQLLDKQKKDQELQEKKQRLQERKKELLEKQQQLLSKQKQDKPEQHVNVAQIFTFDEAAIQQNQATVTPLATPLPTPVKTEGVATPKPIRKALQKSESGEDFWSQIGSRETLYMSNRKKAITERQLETTNEAGELSPKEEAAATTAATTPTLKSAILIELKQPSSTAATTPKTVATTTAKTTAIQATTLPKSTPATPKITTTIQTSATKSEPATPITTTATAITSPKSTPATPKLTAASKLTQATAATPKLTVKTDSKLTATAAATVKTEPAVAISSPKSTPATPKLTITAISLPKSEPATPIATKATSPKSTPATAMKIETATTTAVANPTIAVTAAAIERSGNAAGTTVVMTTESAETTIAGKSKLLEKATTTTTTTAKTTTTTTSMAAPKINTGQTAKSPEQQQATTTAAATAATKINKTTHINERQQQQQQPLDNAATATEKVATATFKQQTETKTKLTETVEPKSKVQSPKTTKPKTATPAATAAKKKVTAATAAAAVTAATTPTTTTLPDSNVTPINADQFITTKAAIAAATNASSPATATATVTAAATAATAIAATTPTTAAIITTIATPTATAASDELRTVAAAAVADVAVDGDRDADDNSCGEGVGNNLSKFATVSNLAQCLRDVDAELEDYIPSSAENSDDDSDDDNSDDSDNSFGDSSSANGCATNLSASMKKKQRKDKKKQQKPVKEPPRFDPQKKIKIDTTSKCYVKEEAPRYPLVATPRPLWKREKIVYSDENTDDESSSEGSEATGGSLEEESDEDDSDACTSNSSSSEDFDDEAHVVANNKQQHVAAKNAPITSPVSLASTSVSVSASASASTSVSASSSPSIIRMSTCSNDSGFEGGTAPSSPKKMLECDVNCHKKCERLTANLCGVNQKLIVEALNHVKRGAREARDSPSTPPSSNPAYKIEASDEHDETSYTYSQFQKSGRFTAPATVIPRFKNYSVDDFHFLAVLGKGSFGKVLLAELRDTTYYYAIKCLKKDVVLEDDDVDSTLIERKVLALGTKHPYLCHLFCTFQTESHLFFVMEYLNGGDLMFHIQESGRFSEERARFYGAEIISGLKFLHKKGIIYRDLKLDNVLLDYEGHVRIADFGMCKLQIYLDKTADSFCGTPDYMAPEIIKGEKYNQNVDWWSFGVLLYEMLIGQSPFSGCDEDELFWSICNEIPWFPVYISAEATGILRGLLEKDYSKRIGSQYSPAGDIADHIFFRPIDWHLLEKRQIEPPFKPQVKHPLDTQYFDRVFTRERVRLTPIDKEILASMDQKQFHGFTYTNPHITLD